jgi:hypothetical protein
MFPDLTISFPRRHRLCRPQEGLVKWFVAIFNKHVILLVSEEADHPLPTERSSGLAHGRNRAANLSALCWSAIGMPNG